MKIEILFKRSNYENRQSFNHQWRNQRVAKGIEWLRKAAKKGDGSAQFNSGMAYLDGEGLRSNKYLARIWFERLPSNKVIKKPSNLLKYYYKPYHKRPFLTWLK
jgi:TPR repeat protein